MVATLEKQIDQLHEANVYWFLAYDNLRRPVQEFVSLLDSGIIDIDRKNKLLDEIREQIKEIK